MGNWKIARGIKTNRVKRGRARRPDDLGRRVDLDGKKRGKKRRRVEPQRAVRLARQNQTGAGDVWTTISISIRAEDLRAIDDLADVMRLSRSAFLVRSGLGLIERLR